MAQPGLGGVRFDFATLGQGQDGTPRRAQISHV